MYTFKHALAVLSLAVPPLVAAGYFVHADLNAARRGDTPGAHVGGGATEGDARLALLRQITGLYVKDHRDAPADMREGAALAPVAFLNHQLEERGEKWRIRQAHGLVAETYNVL